MYWNRPDGTLVRDLPLNRRVMPYIMRTRNESAFYFTYELSLDKTDAFIDEFNATHPKMPIDIFHIAVFALRDVMVRYPTLNRFVAGGRIYQRNDIWFTYSPRDMQWGDSPFLVAKRRFDPDEPFDEMVASMHEPPYAAGNDSGNGNGGANGYSNRAAAEADRFARTVLGLMRTPSSVRRLAMRGVRVVDAMGMLPGSYIRADPMFSSAYFTELAHTGLVGGQSHLQEHGTCGSICLLGTPQPRPGEPDDAPRPRRTLQVSFAFDERMEDGLVSWFGLKHFQRVVEDPRHHTQLGSR